MNHGERLSAVGVGLGLALAPLLRLVRPDLGGQLSERRAAAEDLIRWGGARPRGPLIWLHGASAGELLGAAPTIDVLRARRDFGLLVTHFSPSGRLALKRLAPDHAGYPSPDRAAECDAALAALRPDLLLFAKLDVWPGLAAAAARAEVPRALINGTVRDGSRRLRALSRRLFREAYSGLGLVGAASSDDAVRLEALGARPEAIEVTGDAAFDLALDRANRAREPEGARARFDRALPGLPPRGRRLIAGSTWPDDERALLGALASLPTSDEGRLRWQVVIVPHQPTEARVRDLVGACRARGEPVERWSRLTGAAGRENPSAPDVPISSGFPGHGIIVFDEVGLLAELYTAGDIAFVGGGLGGTGLHNVLEPAAAGLAVLFGGRHDRADAHALEAAGGGVACTPEDLVTRLTELGAESSGAEMGAAARAYVERGAGAAKRTADLLERIWST